VTLVINVIPIMEHRGYKEVGTEQRTARASGAKNRDRDESEKHAVRMLETIPDGVINLDHQFLVLYANPTAAQMLGEARSDMVGKSFWEAVPSACGTKLEKELRRGLMEHKSAEFNVSLEPMSNYFQVLISPCDDGVSVFFRDITEQQRLRQALEEAEAWRSLIFENVKDFAIFSMDVEGRVTLWNPGAEKMYGYSREEIMGKKVDPIYIPEDREQRAAEKEREEATKHHSAPDERWHLRKDGGRFFCERIGRAVIRRGKEVAWIY